MKEASKPIKALFVIFLNTAPFVISVFFHEFGVNVDIFFLFWAITALINYEIFEYKKRSLIKGAFSY